MLYLFFTIFLSVQAADTCDQIPAYTCSTAPLNDATGSLAGQDPSAQRNQELRDQSLRDLTQAYQRALLSRENPISNYNLQLALSATGNTLAPACQQNRPDPEDSRPTFACARILATSLARRANGDIFSDFGPYSPRGGLDDEVLLRRSTFYSGIFEAQRESLSAGISGEALSNRVERNFNTSRGLLNEVIESRVSDPQTRNLLRSKINSIQFNGTDCTGYSGFTAPGAFMRNAFYSADNNTFTYCNGMADLGISDYQLMHIITHELTHAIDPCRIQIGPSSMSFQYTTDIPESEYPFASVLQCLRSPDSVQAFDPTAPPPSVHVGGVVHGGGMPGLTGTPEPFCGEGDQINESFCDWMGAEVLYRHMSRNLADSTRQQHIDGVSSIWRHSCHDQTGLGESNLGMPGQGPHPATLDRLSRITLAHPGIRRTLGCEPLRSGGDVQYCDPAREWMQPSSPQSVEPRLVPDGFGGDSVE